MVDLTNARETLIGTWKLLSVVAVLASNLTHIVDEPLGPTPFGRITFTPSNYMHAFLTSPWNAYPNLNTSSWNETSAEEKLKITGNMTTYMGYWELDEKEEVVRTRVDMALFTKWTGTLQRREYVMAQDGNRTLLTLQASVGERDGIRIVRNITWEKCDEKGC
ncbi:hypothetical protein GQ43DRAFT_438908 [Delitschia confertaspora ATCC 74209]|uniref:Lipocalin-like domain-containing protein n=1 Tax=Delitschia confertaspora ATCC 74209 TaxID=1513339 RepID=A0A9P4JQ47_9PLEO|nr:hypothetical protein GQ43DRAFT_438908 [Delitschia confertaspora ATCC 74209]